MRKKDAPAEKISESDVQDKKAAMSKEDGPITQTTEYSPFISIYSYLRIKMNHNADIKIQKTWILGSFSPCKLI